MEDSLCICDLLKAAASCSEKQLNDAVFGLKISQCQASVLLLVKEQGTASMSSLSRTLCCHKSNITQIVDGLFDQGLISRIPCKEDRRVCRVALTAKGKTLLKKAEDAMRKSAEKCVGIFTASECTQLRKLLKRYVTHMQAQADSK